MFAADLTWQVGESVGQRRERKARESTSEAHSIRTSVTSRSSRSSTSTEKEWWTAGLKKIRTKASSKSFTKERPVTSPQQKSDLPPFQSVPEPTARHYSTWELELPHHLKESSPKPACTLSKSLSSALPSGGSMDLLECDVPELEGDMSSRYTHSITSVSSRKSKRSIIILSPKLTGDRRSQL